MRKLLRGTIWDAELLREVPRRFRGIYTVALPIVYALIVGFSVAGTWARVPSVDLVTSVDYGDVWTVLLGLTSLATGVGLVWRREGLELYATIALVIGYATYPIAAGLLWIFAADATRAPLAFGLWVLVVLPIWRIFDLIHVIPRRRDGEKEAAAHD